MKKIILSALALVALASCSKDNETVDPDVVSITSGITTRASGTKWASGDLIGVFATEVTEAKSEVGKSNSQYKASTSGEKSTFTPIDYIYYPPTANIDILAYYPYNDATTTTATNYDVNVYTNQGDHTLIDLMTAKAEDQKKSSSAIELTFDHKLSQIEVTLVAKENGGFKDSELADATVTVGGTIVEASYNLSDNAITFDDEADATNLTLEASSNVATFIVIPQKSTPKFTIKVDGVDYEVTASELTMESGNTYTYTISVSKTAVLITGSKINDWGSGTGDSLDASDYVVPDIALVGDTYQISTAAGLAAFASIVNEGADVSRLNTEGIEETSIAQNRSAKGLLMNDIDLSTICSKTLDTSWNPIGNSANSYEGIFDGNGFEVQNLYINATSGYQGLFGITVSATIKNIGVTGSVTISGEYSYCGGIIGKAHYATNILNCYNKATISSDYTYNGGIVGYAKGTIENCYNEGDVSGDYWHNGGIVGYTKGVSIKNCYNIGDISGVDFTAGIAGESNNYYDTIYNCYNLGNITSSGCDSGGITGYNAGTLVNCYNTGDIIGESLRIGGVVGYNIGGTVANVYNVGSVEGSQYVGGLVGRNASSATLKIGYNVGEVSGDSDVGSVIGNIHSGNVAYCYYLNTLTADDNATPLEELYMISDDFVTDLNNDITSSSTSSAVAWKAVTNTFPTLEL